MMQIDDMPETSELATFARVVEAKSISLAARELGVPRPTVGRRLARLEERLGVRLLRRSTRKMALTEAGALFYQRARSALASVVEARDAVQRADGAVRGLLRVSAPTLQGWQFGELVASFLAHNPEVRLELESTTRHVDLLAGGFDVAIRASTDLAPGLVARALGKTRLVAVASPEYLASAPAVRTVADLARHKCIVGYDRGEHPATHWPLVDGGRVRVEARFASNDIAVMRECAVRGAGVAMLPEAAIVAELESGALVPLLERKVGAIAVIAAVYAERAFVAPAVRAFIDAVVEWTKKNPIIRPVRARLRSAK